MPGENENIDYFELTDRFAVDGREGNSDWRSQGRKCRRFIEGDQWDEADRDALEAQGVLPLTINHCLPIRDNICGRERQMRKDFRARANKGGKTIVANILTAIAKHAMDISNGTFEKSEMFKDGIGTGRGYLGIDINYDNDPFAGDIEVRHFSPFRVDPDPLCKKYDLNLSGRYINCWDWVDKDEIHAKYPEKVEELEGTASGNSVSSAVAKGIKAVKDFMLGVTSCDDDEEEIDDADIKVAEYRYWVNYRYFKSYETVEFWCDSEAKTVILLDGDEQKKRASESVKYMPERFEIKKAVRSVLHKIVCSGGVLLEHTVDPFKFRDMFDYAWSGEKPQVFIQNALFPIVPFYPYFEDGKTFGKIDNLIGPQQEENKRRTQFLRIINSTANSGWMYQKGALSPEFQVLLEEFGSRPGINIEFDQVEPKKIQPNSPPNAHLVAAQMPKEDMKEISNVNNESLAYDTKGGMSGYALDIKVQESMTGNMIIFDNFDRSSAIFANLLCTVIRAGDFYSADEIEAIIDDSDFVNNDLKQKAAGLLGPTPAEPPSPDPAALKFLESKTPGVTALITGKYKEALTVYQQQAKAYNDAVVEIAKKMVLDEVKNIRTGRYSIKMTASPTSATMRMARFSELLEIDKLRPGQIPLEAIIEASDLQDKEKVIEMIKERTNVGNIVKQ